MTADMPRPLAAPGVVTIDAHARTLAVKPAKDARNYAKVLWSEGHRAQVEDLKTGMIGTIPTVWANGAGHRQIAHGLPGDDGTMRFRFRRPELQEAGQHARSARDDRRRPRDQPHSRRQIPRAQVGAMIGFLTHAADDLSAVTKSLRIGGGPR